MTEFKVDRKNILGVDIILVEGPQGVGKTSFVVSLLSKDYKYHHKERTKSATEFSNMLNREYGYNLHIKGRHLYYSNIPAYLDKRRIVKTWSCDFSTFALPNDNFEVDYYPPWSVLFFTEIDVQAYSRNWQSFSQYYMLLFKYFRHMHYTIILDLQVDGALEKSLRSLETVRISMYESNDLKTPILKRKRGRIFRFLRTSPQILEFARSLRKLEGMDLDCSSKMKFKYKGNIFKQYNSFSGIPYFLYKIKEWSFKPHEDEDLSPTGITRYVKELHPLRLPEEDKKKKK